MTDPDPVSFCFILFHGWKSLLLYCNKNYYRNLKVGVSQNEGIPQKPLELANSTRKPLIGFWTRIVCISHLYMHRFPAIFKVLEAFLPGHPKRKFSVCTWTSLVILMGFLHVLFWVTQKKQVLLFTVLSKIPPKPTMSAKTDVNTQQSYIIAPNCTIIAAGKALVWIMTAPNGTFGFTIQPQRFRYVFCSFCP